MYTENVYADEVETAYRDRLDEIEYVVEAGVTNESGNVLTVRAENDSEVALMESSRGSSETFAFLGPDAAGYKSDFPVTAYATGPTVVTEISELEVEQPRDLVSSHLRTAQWDAVGVRDTDSGKRVVLNATGVAEESAPWTTGEVRSIDGSLDVNGDGLITNGSITYTVERDGETETRTFTVEVERRSGTFVTEPSWLSEPPHAEASAEADGKLFAVDFTDGPALDAGTTVHVNSTDTWESLGSVTLDERVESGDTFYVYRTEDNGTTSYHATVGDRPTLPENATAFTQTAYVSASVDDLVVQAGVEIADGSGAGAAAHVESPERVSVANPTDRSPTESNGHLLLGLAALAPVGLFARRRRGS